jgi:hypothetical protein
MKEKIMDIHEMLPLQDCPFCRGAGLLEEEGGWSWFAVCMDCGAQTASIEYKTPDKRLEAAQAVAHLWNIGKILRPNPGE